MSSDFQTVTHGKWILAGEHAVIRGYSALVFPLLEKTLQLQYTASPTSSLQYTAKMLDGDPQDTVNLLQQILAHGFRCIDRSLVAVQGHLQITSTIPAGVGMGASAALCVAIARWFVSQQWISAQDEFSIARELEHFFHGKSSGLDIIGVSSTTGMHFQNSQATRIHPTWTPKWQLSFCGQQGPTANCIQTVQQLWATAPKKAEMVDQNMQAAVMAAKHALESPYTDDSPQRLALAIQQAHACFQDWGLITPALQQHMHDLQNQGALAVKPTGSGGGGYVMSLWNGE